MRNLTQWDRPSKEAEIIAADPRRELPIMLSGKLACETGHLLATAKEVIFQDHASESRRPKLLDIIARGRLIDLRIQDWGVHVSGKFKYISMTPADIPASEGVFLPGSSFPIHLYSSRSMANLWNTHRCARIILLQCLKKCVALLEDSQPTTPDPESDWAIDTDVFAPKIIQDLISEICASVPYLLGEVDQHGNLQQHQPNHAVGGLFLIWPLRIAARQDCARREQKIWITKQLQYIKNVFGIQVATNRL